MLKVLLGVVIGIVVVAGALAYTNGYIPIGAWLPSPESNARVSDEGQFSYPGQRLVANVEHANGQAGRLNRAFNDMNPVAQTVSYNYNANGLQRPANSEAKPPSESLEAAGNTCSVTDEDILASVSDLIDEEGVESETDEKFVMPADSSISQSYKLMETYASLGTVCNDKYVKAAELLLSDWDAQYTVVRDEYNNFHDMVETAKSTADEYFTLQSSLTSEIKNAQRQQEQRQNDMREIEIFDEWQGQADNTVLSAYKLMDDIEDMRIIIQKASLSAHFAALNKQALSLPASLTELHSQLELFHERSREIQVAFTGEAQPLN